MPALRPLALLALAALALPGSAQMCTGNLFKNDSLPDVPDPTVLQTVSVIQGLCLNEAAASVFQLPPGTPPQRLTDVAVGFAHAAGTVGFTAVANVEIYDGVTFPPGGGMPVLGAKVFDLVQATGQPIQLVTNAINVVGVAGSNVVVGQGTSAFAVAFRLTANPSGNCTSGFKASFFTDNTLPPAPGPCDPQITKPKTNLGDISTQGAPPVGGPGWHDLTQLKLLDPFGNPVPFCPQFYQGNWAIRACGVDASVPNPLSVTVQNAAPPGGFVNLSFNAPASTGATYVAACALGTSPGLPTPLGVVPLNPDALFLLSLSSPGTFINFVGAIGAGGSSPGIIAVPPSPALSGLAFFCAFVTLPPNPGVSPAASVQIL